MKDVLFVSEKWCDFNPALGLTNTLHNFVKTFSSYGKHRYNTLHTDEVSLIYGADTDDTLFRYCENYPVDIIIFSLVNHSKYDPSIECLQRLRDKGKYLCVLWPDTGYDWGLKTIEKLTPINLHLSYDNPYPVGGAWTEIYDRNKWGKNHIAVWTPEDDSLYYPEEKTIDISLLGSTKLYVDRTNVKETLKQRYKNIYIGGGQREEKLSPEQYASVIRKSKIGINFSLSQTGVFYQAKGRIFEYTASNSLLLDSFNPSTQDYYTSGIDYQTFSSIDELIYLIDYFLENEKQREEIAMNGYNKFKNNWTSNHWWDLVMNYIEKDII